MQKRVDESATQRAVIELRIHELGQLFNSLDPSPFHERDIDDEAESYIVGWALEHGAGLDYRIVIHMPSAEAAKARESDIGLAIANYFDYRAGMLERELHELIRTGWRFLGLGMSILLACMALGYLARVYVLKEPYGLFLEQGLSVFGWVANWRPLEILLYDRWMHRRRVALYRRLALAEVSVRAS